MSVVLVLMVMLLGGSHLFMRAFVLTVFSQLNAPGVYFKLGILDPAFA